MQEMIDDIRKTIESDFNTVKTSGDIEEIKVKYLGRKGSIQQLMQCIKQAPAEERPHIGKMINELKTEVSTRCEQTLTQLFQTEEKQRLAQETLDVTLPGRRNFLGHEHLLTRVLNQVVDVLAEMGFSVQVGPDIETDYYNFEALNFSKDHPARDMQDTFYITDDLLLRTQMTSIQMRVMENQKPPLRIMAPGKSYRNEDVTARSHVFFHQVDVFYIDKGVTFADLLATKKDFLRKLFPEGVKWRFRPSYFPFVEPGMEVDINCVVCHGKGCHICKYSGWLEITGAGMIHPEVLKNGDIDPEEYTGFAWGMGLERLVMVMCGISDIRLFTENDLRFLEQF